MVLVSFLSFVNYENSTEPTGIYCETQSDYYFTGHDPISGQFGVDMIKNYSFLGNSISLGYVLQVEPASHCVNLSNAVGQNITRGCMISSIICLYPLTSVNWPYSHPVVTILNTSLSVNNTVFKNGTDKSDSFGPFWTFSESSNRYSLNFHLYEKGDYEQSNKSAYKLPISSIMNPGNYTFYENTTFTVSLSMDFMHFTSQSFHLDESWWVVYKYNDK